MLAILAALSARPFVGLMPAAIACASLAALGVALRSIHAVHGGLGFLLVTISVVPLKGTPLETLRRVTLANRRVDVVHRSDCNDPASETVLRDVGDVGEVSIDTTMPLVGQIVARMPIPIGCVMQVRFIVESASLTMDGVTECVVPGLSVGVWTIDAEGRQRKRFFNALGKILARYRH